MPSQNCWLVLQRKHSQLKSLLPLPMIAKEPRGWPMSAFQNPEVYRTVLESLQTGVCIVDPIRRIVLWESVSCTGLGLHVP